MRGIELRGKKRAARQRLARDRDPTTLPLRHCAQYYSQEKVKNHANSSITFVNKIVLH